VSSVIRSVRLLVEEIDALQKLSADRNVAVNALVRIAVRRLVGLPVPSWAERIAA